MPAKATVFNLKCDPVFDFGTGPRNAAYYSPHGHILVLAGFGNLRGQMEVWDVKNYKLISKPVASDSTYFAWCPDGEHIVTATCAPRLRVSNGYKIWHYTGSVLHSYEVPSDEEMWQVFWQPFLDGVFPEKAVKYQAVPSELPSAEPRPAQAYRPPALRNKPVTSSKLVSSSVLWELTCCLVSVWTWPLILYVFEEEHEKSSQVDSTVGVWRGFGNLLWHFARSLQECMLESSHLFGPNTVLSQSICKLL